MNIKLEADNDFSVLICPGCGGNNLHHGDVEVFARNGEDSVYGKHVTVEINGWSNSDELMDNNPSARRSGILINLECEDCSKKSVLAIVQHKGETHLSMGIVDKKINYHSPK